MSEEIVIRAGRREWVALGVLALPLLLVSMDVSILYFAAPEIARDLDAGPAQQLWIFDVYGFVLAGMLIPMGALADRLGARRLLLIGAVAFSLTSWCAAFAGTVGHLIAARGVLGVAGATLMPSTLAMIRQLFRDERQRGVAIGAWTGVMTAGVGLGPVVSGVLLAHFWWGSVFLVNIPAMLLLLVCGPLLPSGERHAGARLDLLSAATALLSMLMTVFGIKQIAVHGLQVAPVLALVGGVGLGALFLRRQFVHEFPLIPPSLLRDRIYRAALVGATICSFAVVGNAVFMTAYLQLVLGQTPLTAALWSLVPTAGVLAAAPLAAPLGERIGPDGAAAAGLGVGAVGFVALTRIGVGDLATTLVGAGLLAAGVVMTMTVCSEKVLAALDPERAGTGSALSEAATELGGALGIALLGSIGAAGYRAAVHLPNGAIGTDAEGSLAGAAAVAVRLPTAAGRQVLASAQLAYVHGLHLAAATGAAVLLVSAIGFLVRRPLAGVHGRTEQVGATAASSRV
ncbi:MFS transporter [Nocardioides fonticola]|uniref:MFS transporter n=1 Tax=Nocardioides fonticola TaxID=450363 RepID=A0ABP7XKJ1_9ACTN